MIWFWGLLVIAAVSGETSDASTRVWLEVDETQLVKNAQKIAGKQRELPRRREGQ